MTEPGEYTPGHFTGQPVTIKPRSPSVTPGDQMTKSTYPLVEKLGLDIRQPHRSFDSTDKTLYIKVPDLERLLESLPVVSGGEGADGEWYWAAKNESIDTHRAKLLLIEPIKRGVTRKEIEQVIYSEELSRVKAGDLLKRILDEGLEREKEREGL